jgi:hypothetical protein
MLQRSSGDIVRYFALISNLALAAGPNRISVDLRKRQTAQLDIPRWHAPRGPQARIDRLKFAAAVRTGVARTHECLNNAFMKTVLEASANARQEFGPWRVI